MLRIIHLSDFHLNESNSTDYVRTIIPALIEDLKKYAPIDLVVLSGDLIDRGGQSLNGAELGFQHFKKLIIEPLLTNLQLSQEKLVFVAGNHDVVRGIDTPTMENGMQVTLTTTEEVNKKQKNKLDDEGIKRVHDFKHFEKQFHENTSNYYTSNYESTYIIEKENLKIGIACINSSWRCYDSAKDKGKLIVGEHQISSAYEQIKDCRVKIAVMHHSLEHLVPFDIEAIEPYLDRFNILLLGHDHSNKLAQKSNFKGTTLVSMVPANSEIRTDSHKYTSGYRIIDYPTNDNRVLVHTRQYSKDKLEFTSNSNYGNDNGICELSIPVTELIESQKLVRRIIDTISQNEYEDWNKHLVGYNIAPSRSHKIEDIFVEPKIVLKQEKISSSIEGLKEECISTDEIIRSGSNYIILGQKDTGKTVLLDKIAIDLCKNIDTYHCFPVVINFNSLHHTTIEKQILKFLNITNKELSSLYTHSSLLLLIDNIDFNADSRIVRNIKKFIENNNARIITTYKQSFEEDIPDTDIAKSSIDFLPLKLKRFGSAQIRQLAYNWLGLPTESNLPKQLINTLSACKTLRIPATPLYISILLWIYEKNETHFEPINLAATIENFIETIFKKSSVIQVTSSSFSYKSYSWLLSELAYKMNSTGNVNYSLPQNEVLSFVLQILKQKGLSNYSASDIIENLLNNGILILKDNNIQFRLGCFFSFYISKKMQDDEIFLEEVLKKDNYLNYIEELDYYTALENPKEKILDLFITRMDESYSKLYDFFINEKILTNTIGTDSNSFDQYFKNKDTILQLSSIDFNESISDLDQKRTNQQDLDSIEDMSIEISHNKSEVENRPKKLSNDQTIGRQLRLVSGTIRNYEFADASLKSKAYDKLLWASQIYTIYLNITNAILYNEIDEIDEIDNSSKNHLLSFIRLMRDFAPLFIQKMVSEWIGTKKLEVVLAQELERQFSEDNTNHLKLFLALFLYTDIEGTNWEKYLKRYININTYPYLQSSIYIQLTYLYIFRSKTRQSDLLFQNLMADLIMKSSRQHKYSKTKIIEEIEKNFKKDKQNIDNQFSFDFYNT